MENLCFALIAFYIIILVFLHNNKCLKDFNKQPKQIIDNNNNNNNNSDNTGIVTGTGLTPLTTPKRRPCIQLFTGSDREGC